MKSALATILLLLSTATASAQKIDRSTPLMYPVNNIGSKVDKVYVLLEKGYAYHNYHSCDTENKLLGTSRKSFVEMTEYEAILRGFFECPDCTDRAEDIDVLYVDDIKDTVDDIESMVEDIYNALFR